MTEIKDRVVLLRHSSGMTQQELANKVGVTQQAIFQLENGIISRPRYIVELASVLGVTPEWLLTGSGDKTRVPAALSEHELQMAGNFETWDGKSGTDSDEIELPLFREVELAAGSGRTQVQENKGAKLKFAKSSLRKAGVPEEAAACAYVNGNSMEPALQDGATVGVNTADTQVRDGKLYALDHEGMLRIKQLKRIPGGGLRLVSFNKAEHPDEEYTAEEVAESIRIIGRVFWYATFL